MGYSNKVQDISELVGKLFTKVELSDEEDMIRFYLDDDKFYEMFHSQDCCESVIVDDIEGDFQDLVNSPILQAEESTNSEDKMGKDSYGYENSFTWTFYRFATIKGYVTIKWYGTSNGYYSESIDIERRGFD